MKPIQICRTSSDHSDLVDFVDRLRAIDNLDLIYEVYHTSTFAMTMNVRRLSGDLNKRPATIWISLVSAFF